MNINKRIFTSKFIDDFAKLLFKPLLKLEYQKRMKVAKELIEHLKECGVNIVTWKVTGSTKRWDFCFSSDLDINILVKTEKDRELAKRIALYFSLQTIRKHGLLIDFFIDSLEYIERFKVPKFRQLMLNFWGYDISSTQTPEGDLRGSRR